MKSLLAFIAMLFVVMTIANNAFDVFAKTFEVIAAIGIVVLLCCIGVMLGRVIDERMNF